jgi:hypothetical protein
VMVVVVVPISQLFVGAAANEYLPHKMFFPSLAHCSSLGAVSAP